MHDAFDDIFIQKNPDCDNAMYIPLGEFDDKGEING